MEYYPSHEEIEEQINKLVKANLGCQSMHNRENLDDIIADLEQYRDQIPSIDEYLDAGKL
jgi:hypothetical protein